MTRLGLVTIGQAPRVDLLGDVWPLLRDYDVVERGALDDLDADGLAAIAPPEGEHALVSRLRDATFTRIDPGRILPLVDAAVDRCVADGAGVVLILCTGRLALRPASIPVLHAEEVAHEAVAADLGSACLGVLCPLPEQVADMSARWRERLGRPALVAAVNPYASSVADIRAAADELAAAGADRLFLDCIGYSEAQREAAAGSGIPASTARSLAVEGLVRRIPA